jgi:hypothetical protein
VRYFTNGVFLKGEVLCARSVDFDGRKRAMRALDGRVKENCQNEATGGISFNLSMGKGRSVARKSRRRSIVEIWMGDYVRRHRSKRSHGVTKNRSFRRLRRVTGWETRARLGDG